MKARIECSCGTEMQIVPSPVKISLWQKLVTGHPEWVECSKCGILVGLEAWLWQDGCPWWRGHTQ